MGFRARGGWWVAAQVLQLAAIAVTLTWVEAGLGIGGSARRIVVGFGALLVFGGSVLGLAGVVALGRNITPYPEPLGGGRLVAHGPYRLVRHPIYGAVALSAIGLSLMDVNAAALAPALALTAFFHAKAHHEEARLMEAYPDYAAYAAQTRRRLIPWVI